MHPVEGAVVLSADFTSPQTQERITELLDDRLVDVVLSDMAPSASGVRQLDQDCILQLAYSVVNYSRTVSKEGGCLLVKLWAGGGVSELEKQLKLDYANVKVIKPQSSRQDSAELFLLARDFLRRPTT